MLAGISIAGSAFVAGLALSASPVIPQSAAFDSSAQANFELTSQTLLDARAVKLTVAQGAQTEVQVPRTGTVTAIGCVPGIAIMSWSNFIAVDGVKLLSLATTTPLYRDLRAGDSGDDVRALQAELVRLGENVRVDGVLGSKSIQVVNNRIREIGGVPSSVDTISKDEVVWLPMETGTAASCPIALGASVATGDVVAALETQATGANVSALPSDLVPGPRVAVVGDLRLAVDESGRIVSSEEIATLRASPTFAQASQGSDVSGAAGSAQPEASGGGVVIDASLELASPLETWAVPPGAVFALNNARGCVSSNGESLVVDVVGSELGKTYVLFPNSEVPQSVDVLADPPSTCQA
ncbi:MULTISPECIES: peptidoglycan-binding domain-containing protein [unclassified Rathayibacter]|uniref:peptidoglycan-binding domain-containing protein n=1 Tax=unclassified Rathayibacter TaxID=2609250 RepID=UPI00188AE038|nr:MULTISPECIES: hypothetical protein [unclassified Rathayibacter]MBF4461798.1 hypothetical protein [Rathayibacter sp. VKM Ac-2879]MBF4503211.1 hypothetical protein [Rathayibacter sp. VKM Ac-2878]